jgi:type IV pilus assembly protein PilY1
MKLVKAKSSHSATTQLGHIFVAVVAFWLSFALCHVQAAEPEQTPLFLSVGARPHIALVMSVDHELFKKAYSDYANLDGNDLTMDDTTYRDDFDYYGYFDSDWCYSYSENSTNKSLSYFTPHSKAVAPSGAGATTKTHHCIGAAADTWSGNFLNWVSMTRMDIVRRVLFGGKRSVDDTNKTILERAYLPKDVHAFAKVYGGSDIDITPFTPSSFQNGKTYSFCNVSTSHDINNGYPLIRTAEGSWPLWATVESAYSGGNCQLNSNGHLMPKSVMKDYTAKVEACVVGKNASVTVNTKEEATPRCRRYGNNYKPIGLLQKHGESGAVNFSLMSGSYKANHSGGVLRKAAGPLVSAQADNSKDEINIATGQFNNVKGIISNISKFRISTYDFGSSNGYYKDCNTWSISIQEFKTSTDSGRRCRDWGNPLSEIYLETLRYISGAKKPTTKFSVDDSTSQGNYPGIAGLSNVTWDDPWPKDQYCAKCGIIVLSTGSNSFDGDDLGSVTDLTGMTVEALKAKTDAVGVAEYESFSGKKFFMGGLDAKSRYCQAFELAGLSNYTGICPELPALEGTYHIAGLAYYARTTDLRPDLPNGTDGERAQQVNTYAVDLAETVPTIPLNVDGKIVQILPACESNKSGSAVDATASEPWSTCSLFDVKIHSLKYSGGNLVSGSMTLYWEDSLWGYDYDLDVAQQLDFCVGPSADGCNDANVGASEIRIKNTIPYAEAGNALRLSYAIYGVQSYSGTWSRSGTTNTIAAGTAFTGGVVTPWMLRPGGDLCPRPGSTNKSCNYSANTESEIPAAVGKSTFKFVASNSNAVELPKKPLFLAAKYGGFKDSNGNNLPDLQSEWDRTGDSETNGPDSIPDNFFSVKNPALLEESLDAILKNFLSKIGSASAVATSSTRVQEGQFVYQARFDSSNWTGELLTYKVSGGGTLENEETASTRNIAINSLTSSASRKIVTYKPNATGSGGSTVNFTWNNLSGDQQTLLTLTGDATGTPGKRVDWLRGSSADEDEQTGFRPRTWKDENDKSYRNVIGDIVNSSPVFVGANNERYYTLPSAMGGDKYIEYLNWKKGDTSGSSPSGYPASPAPRVIVGSNGGMVHAFHADTLEEIFAYVPNAIFHKLAKLTERDYGSDANEHQYLVDGPIVAGDAFITVPGKGARSWRSVVVGTYGAGAKGLYALDVTDESNPVVLFEYNHADLGYILGRPVIVPTSEGRWVIITGNGVDSGTRSKLFIIDLEDPYNKTKIMDGGAGTTEMSAPAVLTNSLGVATVVYAGNLSGEVRRFDISDASNTNWTSYRVFSAISESGDVQSIVAAPTIGYNNKLGRNMVYFGTGKYHDAIDKEPGKIRHSFYAVPDMGSSGSPKTRADFHPKKLVTDYNATTPTRVVENDSVDWEKYFGWYVDLDNDEKTRDERVTIKAVLIQDRILVTTLIPSQENCLAGGSSWLMELTAVGDGYKNVNPVPAKYSPELFLGDQNVVVFVPEPGDSKSSTSSVASSGASSSTDDNCGADIQGGLISSGTSGNKPSVAHKDIKACMVGRQSWQQLK